MRQLAIEHNRYEKTVYRRRPDHESEGDDRKYARVGWEMAVEHCDLIAGIVHDKTHSLKVAGINAYSSSDVRTNDERNCVKLQRCASSAAAYVGHFVPAVTPGLSILQDIQVITADIAIGHTLLNLNYAYVSTTVIWVYDYIITFSDELAFIRNSNWGAVKLLYLLCRYLPFVLLGTDTYQVLQPALPLSLCETYFGMNSWLEGFTLVAAECMFILRTYAIWGRNRRVLTILMSSFVAILIPVVYIIISFGNSITISEPPIPNITSCYNVGESRIIVVAYLLLVVAEFEILFFTLYRSIQHYKNAGGHSPLLKTLLQHNIFYFTCGLVFSLIVILTIGLLPSVYGDMTSNLQVTVHALLVTRMHLELWKSDRKQRFVRDDVITLDTFQAAGSRDTYA
ncbi:hypothetical protein DFH29DRAFT_325774 [Suillus ampliporus]|nr:hypothetical protein DFH29DRAFT_325774 [Suillus ampliporus]